MPKLLNANLKVFPKSPNAPQGQTSSRIFPLVINSEGQASWLENILVLTWVCKYWRNLAHTPLLWNKQCIPINPGQFFLRSRRHRKKPVNIYFKDIETWLARSAPLPVPVSLNVQNFRTFDEFSRAVDLILSVAARWKTLNIATRTNTYATTLVLRALAHLPGGTLQALTAVTLNLSSVRPPKVLSVFMSAARLRRVELRVGPETVNLMSMPLAQLTHITLTRTTPRACFATLAECTNIVSAALRCEHMETVQDDPDSALSMSMATAILPHLATLRVWVSPALIQGLRHLVLPSLKALELSDHYMAWPPPETFRPFLLSAPTLQRLRLLYRSARRPSSADLCALLRCTPSLTTLEVVDRRIAVDNTLLDALRADLLCAAVLLPQLETLSLECNTEVGAEESLLALIASRWRTDNAVRLKRISYKGGVAFGRTLKETLDTYRAEGLDVEIIRFGPIATQEAE
ncbi:hypothetical protein B0H13DRAFT_2268573 [Mycena leptocephala]|nr:hypothetical protein B0H13DRAFT_2268573 [Mycena leptocephala]